MVLLQSRCACNPVRIENRRAVMRLARNSRLWHRSIRNILPVAVLSLNLLFGAPPPPQPTANTLANSQDPLNRDSPQSAVISFLKAYHAHDYVHAAKYLDLRK